MKLREAADQQSEAMKSLKAEVERMRQQLAEDNEKYRVCLDEVGRGLAALTTSSPDQKTQPVKGASDKASKDLKVLEHPDSGLPRAPSSTPAADSEKKGRDASRGTADREREGVEREPEATGIVKTAEETSKEEKEETKRGDKEEDLVKDTKAGNAGVEEGTGNANGGEDDKKGEEDVEEGKNEAKGGDDDKKDDDAEEENDSAKRGDDDTKDGDGDANDGDDATGGDNEPDEDGSDAQGNADGEMEGADEGKGEPDDSRGSADGTEGEAETKEDAGTGERKEEDSSEAKQEEPCEDEDCERCVNWTMIMDSLEDAIQGLQLDINKQAARIDRLSARERAQCDNCVMQHLVLGAVYNRLDNVDKYSHMLDNRIQSLSHRLLSC
ncbi:retinitis pigmentosa 1-like 1 protein [Penaeus monodon]|uniref:retinitis pigmentosa 1-like 1 protein n=1 Tax=Penaeus monodon TaxID=6687 RepID=UPI0018A7C195|nr:retinitis pigmentosa 1-like 1 protein [Penaeus monodon]